jgi:hypothetical protein
MYILSIGANLVFAQFNKAIIRSDHKKGDHKDRPYRGMQENLLGGKKKCRHPARWEADSWNQVRGRLIAIEKISDVKIIGTYFVTALWYVLAC